MKSLQHVTSNIYNKSIPFNTVEKLIMSDDFINLSKPNIDEQKFTADLFATRNIQLEKIFLIYCIETNKHYISRNSLISGLMQLTTDEVNYALHIRRRTSIATIQFVQIDIDTEEHCNDLLNEIHTYYNV